VQHVARGEDHLWAAVRRHPEANAAGRGIAIHDHRVGRNQMQRGRAMVFTSTDDFRESVAAE
jgi:hypothetical protein